MARMFMGATSFDRDVSSFETRGVLTMREMFRDAASFRGNGLGAFDTSAVESMEGMFQGAVSLVNREMVNWNVERTMDFSRIFAGATRFSADLCPWRTHLQNNPIAERRAANVFVASGCARPDDPNLDSLGTSAFCAACAGSTDWAPPPPPELDYDTAIFGSKVFTSTAQLRRAVDEYILDNSNSTPVALLYGHPLATWDVSRITDFSELFSAQRNPNMIRFNDVFWSWDTRNAVTMASMFEGTLSFTDDVCSLWYFDTRFVTDLSRMFAGSAITADMYDWDTSRVRSVRGMFEHAVNFNRDISRWDTSAVTDMSGVFRGAISYNQVMNWDTQSVQSFDGMFAGAMSFDRSLCEWSIGNASVFGMLASTQCAVAEDPVPGTAVCQVCPAAVP